jgi:hypothetical protein
MEDLNLNSYFDHVYLINISADRLHNSQIELAKIGLTYEVFPATNAYTQTITWNNQNSGMPGWTVGAAGLVYSTKAVIQDAKTKGYQKILILEDDLVFSQDIKTRVTAAMDIIKNAPLTWELLHFAATDYIGRTWVSEGLAKLNGAWSCQMYAVNSSIFDTYLTELNKVDKPIDLITSGVFHPRGKSYCINPGIVKTVPNFSTIRNAFTDHGVQ